MATVVLAVGDAGAARLYEIQLSLDGHRVLVARDADDAGVLCRAADPDLVVADSEVPAAEGPPVLRVEPGMTGPQVSQAVRRRL